MGSYIKSTTDVLICESLNSRFSDQTITQNDPAYVAGCNETFIDQLRRHRGHERLFDGNHNLDRVVHRLHWSLGGGAVPANQNARWRWYWLGNNRPGNLRPLFSAQTRGAICSVLDYVLANPATVQRVYFDAQVVLNTPSGGFELDYSQNAPHPPHIVNGVCLMTLNCPLDQQIVIAGVQPDPPPQDQGEVAINSINVP